MAFDPTRRYRLNKSTRAFLADWLAWVDRGAPEHDPYLRGTGLCFAAKVYDPVPSRGSAAHADLDRLFTRECGPNSYSTPFGDDYFDRSEENTIHRCPKRLAFVRANLPEEKLP